MGTLILKTMLLRSSNTMRNGGFANIELFADCFPFSGFFIVAAFVQQPNALDREGRNRTRNLLSFHLINIAAVNRSSVHTVGLHGVQKRRDSFSLADHGIIEVFSNSKRKSIFTSSSSIFLKRHCRGRCSNAWPGENVLIVGRGENRRRV